MRLPVLTLALASLVPSALHAEAMLQLFNTSWRDVTTKMPELAEAGYTSLWLPPPCKGSGGLSVGYDIWDRFDLGSKDQRGGVRTRYGTEGELKELVRVAHRFGVRVYFDNIMNHNAFDTPGFNDAVPFTVYPGFWPEDFHLRKTADGQYRKWDNTRNWNDAWQVQNLGLADLIDIAHESPNANFGLKEGDTIPKLVTVRQPNNPEYYFDTDLPLGTDGNGATLYTFAHKEPFEDTGWGGAHNGAGNGRFDFEDANGNGQHDPGEVSEPFQDLGLFPGNSDKATAPYGAGDNRYNMGNPAKEDVNALLIRAARWQLDRLNADGFRLDAVKHVPDYFFGQQSGANKDASGAGYNGGIQTQFNLTRGFTDWSNHRNSLFETEIPRDDAMLFGEHLGEPPGYSGYIDAGMRLIDNGLRNELNNRLGNPSSGLQGYDQPGYGGFAPGVAVMHAQSHDSDYASRRELQHAFYFTRAGLGLVYSDGNTHADILGASGGAFPRHANTAYLGQFNDPRIPNVLYLNQHLARGYQVARFSDADFVAYERVDKRDNASMSDADGVTLLFMLNDNYASGLARTFNTSFPATAGGSDAYLFNYSTYNGGFYTYASNLKNVIVPPGGYFAFSWRSPEENTAWKNPGGTPLTILQNNQPVSTVTVTRQDGPQGDPAFNPNSLPDANQTDYRYSVSIPRVTDGSNLRFIARADGSAENILFKLDGGMELNNDGTRDNPPATGTDVYVGYEQGTFAQRHYPEKFAAKNTARCIIGSSGAETYFHTVGSTGSIANGFGANPQGNNAFSFVYHDADGTVEAWPGPGAAPAAQYTETATEVVIYAKANDNGTGETLRLYYTLDSTDPEGGGGQGLRSTQVANFAFAYAQTSGNIGEWWRASFPKPAAGTAMRYKVGAFKNLSGGNPVASIFPTGATEVANKKDMATVFEISNFNATAASFRVHADYGDRATGLEEGFHMIRARAFLKRDGRASIYNTFQQSFYYDTKVPDAAIIYPGNDNDVLGGSNYGVVVRADFTTTEVWYRITDSAANNDDTATGVKNGNGAWVRASEVTASLSIKSDLPREFRFNYNNIPSSGTGQIEVLFREISSGTDFNADPAVGHFKKIVRPVNTAGPSRSLYIAFPRADGDLVDASYVLKAYLSKNLADGLSNADALARFTVALDSSQNNDSSDAVALPASALSLVYNETATDHALAFSLDIPPGTNPDTLHEVIVTHREPGGLTTTATRQVRLQASASVYLDIVNPAELDSDGKPVVLLFPLKPAGQLTAADRTFSVRVATADTVGSVTLDFTFPASPGANTLTPAAANPQTVGSQKFWDFAWTGVTEGAFQLRARAYVDGNLAATRLRAATTAFRQLVTANDSDLDDDDDGLSDATESNAKALPDTADTAWTNGDVHLALISGLTNPLSPDTDGDGLPDGLELGWRAAQPGTSTAADTDGDGFPNFAGDLDPPFYNTADNSSLPNYLSGQGAAGRTRLIHGSVTDPNNPDTDGDGLPDGLEDANHNGWTDGDGEPLAANATASPARNFPNGKMDLGETWLETSPSVADGDGDGLVDGYGEDKDLNGYITGDTNKDRAWQPGELWTETDPLKRDTDGDGLPDGWEVQNGLDPLDNGTLSFRTGLAGDPRNGPGGDPDGDTFTNLSEFASGTNPVRFDSPGTPPPAGSIVIGPRLPATTVGGVTNTHEFDDWTINDLLVLDEVEADSGATRDLVAFYARDGGSPSAGGDGNFYFRTDFHDLAAYAEDKDLDIWVIIDVGNTAVGETLLPGQVNALTNMKWDVAVLCDNGTEGQVWVDTNPSLNTTGHGQSLSANGVVNRTPTDANGFGRAWFNSKLDAAEFSISRQALLDAGWNGVLSTLHFQVYTTKDNTGDSPVGSGDRSGRNDLYDTIYDDDVAYAGSTKDTLTAWFGFDGTYDRGRRARVLNVFHGHKLILPGSQIQDLVNTGTGAGLYRLIDAHQAYAAPFTLHVTPTLASALQWASVDPAKNKAWRDGPALNTRIAALRASGVVDVTASTFSDHILPYFPVTFTADNVALADDVLTGIYGGVSSKVFWTPQRVLDTPTIFSLTAATGGRDWTFCDRSTHLVNWFGFSDATYGNNRYRVQRYAGVKMIPLQDDLSDQLFSTADGGASLTMRTLLLNLARDNDPALVCALYQNWQDFTSKTSADSYDQVLAWLAARPWINLVTAGQMAENQVDLSRPADGTGDTFNRLERGTPFLVKTAKVSLQHATQGSYDNWYFGQSGREEGLEPKFFRLRPSGANLPLKYGRVGVDGLSNAAWQSVSGLDGGNPAAWLARAAAHASVTDTAAHEQLNNDDRRFTTGDFIYPDTDYNTLADRARYTAPHIRSAGLAARAAAWQASPPSGVSATSEDVDLDGEPEYVLANSRLLAVFERMGGRLTAAFLRSADGSVFAQVVGNQIGYADRETEEERPYALQDGEVYAHRTSGFKDLYALAAARDYVNDLYAVTADATGFTFTSPDGKVSKAVTLAAASPRLTASYALGSGETGLYVRFGLSPDLRGLLIDGQKGLSTLANTGGQVGLTHSGRYSTTRAYVEVSGAGATNVTWNSLARDDSSTTDFDTLNMRNQAQTQQVEILGTGPAFSFVLGFGTAPADRDQDGIPDAYELANNFDPELNDADSDPDGDALSNLAEYLFGTNPRQADGQSHLPRKVAPLGGDPAGSFRLAFPTLTGRLYRVEQADELGSPWTAATDWLPGTGSEMQHLDPAPGPKHFYRLSVQTTPLE